MNHYTFSGNLRTIFLAMMGVGLLCLGLTWMNDDNFHSRFWSNVLHNSVFFTGIAIMASFFIAASITAYAGWYTAFKRIFEAITDFLVPGFILMTIIGIAVYLNANHLYHWADANSVNTDEILKGKSSFLNKNWYLFGTIIIGAVYIFIMSKIKSLSNAEDTEGGSDPNYRHHRETRKWAAIFLPVMGFTSVALIWQWVMSVDAHWYSTLFAWYCLASFFVAMMCLVMLILQYLISIGYYTNLTQHHVHDVGKFMFGITVFWTYLWFSQFMLIWYGNVGEETIYFKERYDNYPVLFFGNVLINFALPFLVLLRNDTKYKAGSVVFMGIWIFIGHWINYFLMLKPGILHTAHELAGQGAHAVGEAAGHGAEAVGHAAEAAGHAVAAHGAEHVSNAVAGFTFPGLLEFGTMVGFLGFFGLIVFSALTKRALNPKNDPYYGESLHHHV